MLQRSYKDNDVFILILIVFGGWGQIELCDTKLSEKCLYSHHNNTALIKQISLLDNFLVITNN